MLTSLLVGCSSVEVRPAWIRPAADRVAKSATAPLLITSREPTETSRADSPLNLEVLTFNIHGLPSWLGGPRSEQFIRIAHAIQQEMPDIVLLQEAWTAAARKAAPTGAGWHVARSTRSRSFFRQSGLVTASRHRMVHGEFRPFRHAALPDSLVTKGALKVTLELPWGQRVNVWNVHLQAGSAAKVRVRQVAELIQWIRDADDDQLLDLIGGDFNCTPLSAEYRALTAWLGADVQRLDGRPHEPTFRGAREPATMGRTLDYVFCSPHAGASADRARTEVVFASDRPEDRLSDHLGIRASIGVTRRPVAVVSATPGSPAAWPVVTSLRRLLAPFHD